MPVYLSDLEVNPTALTVCHIRRAEGEPILCGSRFGFGVVAVEEIDPWPWDTVCVQCKAIYDGDFDDPEQSAEFL